MKFLNDIFMVLDSISKYISIEAFFLSFILFKCSILLQTIKEHFMYVFYSQFRQYNPVHDIRIKYHAKN